jgi:two-component system, chemotaxis family, CheB/CheR fusion protein
MDSSSRTSRDSPEAVEKDSENADRRELIARRDADHVTRQTVEVLRRQISDLTLRVAEVESLNIDARDSRRAALNLLEDAVESRRLADELNIELRRENAEHRLTQEALQEALAENEQARSEAEAASRAKDHFLAVLSHELRTPLSPVLMTLKTLSRRSDVSDPVREALAMIRRNIRVESQLIDDLLDITRISRGKLTVQSQPLDLDAAIRGAIEITREDVTAKDQTLTVALDAGSHRIDGDFMRLQQVVWNLLKNASKFTPRDGEIRIETRNEPGRVLIVVSDNGIGMDSGSTTGIFEAFAQGGESVTRDFGGLGLGLAISKATVEAHGGTIRAESTGVGQGATFVVELPCKN